MSLLWQHQLDRWEPVPLAGSNCTFTDGGELCFAAPSGDVPAQLFATENGWVLLAEPAARICVNGEALELGLHVLRDRDEIVFGRSRFYFSNERLACVESFPGADGPVFCARCRQEIEPGTPAVKCPGCNCWFHQSLKFPCWQYAPTCPLCSTPSAADAGYRWEPNF